MSMLKRQEAYEHIRGKLVRGELSPGSRLSNRKLAAEIGVSFIPVREAINQLASEGLVEQLPNFGAVVRVPKREELADLYDLRLALECHAAATASQRIGPAEIAELEVRNKYMVELIPQFEADGETESQSKLNDKWMVADAAFHMTVLRAAGNSLVIKTISELRVLARVFGHRREGVSQELLRVCQEHGRIVEAFRQRDEQWARKAMADHISQGRELALRAFDRRRVNEAVGMSFPEELQDQIHELEQR